MFSIVTTNIVCYNIHISLYNISTSAPKKGVFTTTLENYSSILLNQFQLLNVPQEELSHRRNAFNHAISISTQNQISSRYYNLAHELKCLHFLSRFGEVAPALDCSHTDGCDAILNDHYQIEFVCCSPGANTDKSGYDRFSVKNLNGFMLCDYAEKEKFLFSRITTALHAKQTFYEDHISKNTISANKPYIIFLGLGELSYDMLCGNFGIDLTGVLLGKGCPTITINGEGKVTGRGYTHNESFPKYNGAAINCNLFCREEFRCVSGVIFTDAALYDEYTTKNTWLFINPFATTKIRKKDFAGMVYWSANKNSDYFPRRNGKRL
ncbi:MAG: hypothetical protein IKU68_06620 [Oscillospiraceae bacterium]|nr:hypothetical protein [Oscillospiraceae bacterium]